MNELIEYEIKALKWRQKRVAKSSANCCEIIICKEGILQMIKDNYERVMCL